MLNTLKVYLVTGGTVSSTEILVEGDSNWNVVGDLPLTMYGPRAASINNNIILTGVRLMTNIVLFSLF